MSMVAGTHQIVSSSGGGGEGTFTLSVISVGYFYNEPGSRAQWTMGSPLSPTYPSYPAGTVWQELDYPSAENIMSEYSSSQSIVQVGEYWGIENTFWGTVFNFNLLGMRGYLGGDLSNLVAEGDVACLSWLEQNKNTPLTIYVNPSEDLDFGGDTPGGFVDAGSRGIVGFGSPIIEGIYQ